MGQVPAPEMGELAGFDRQLAITWPPRPGHWRQWRTLSDLRLSGLAGPVASGAGRDTLPRQPERPWAGAS